MLDSPPGEVQEGHVRITVAHTGGVFGMVCQGLPPVSSTQVFNEEAGFPC